MTSMPQNGNPVLQASAVIKTVSMPDQELTILSGIDLTVMAAESLAIVGESGSGKSTLLGLLAGLDVPSSGAISLMGQALNSMTEDQRAAVRAAHVGFVFQSFQLLPNLTALENVMLPLEIADEKAVPERARNMLAKVGLEKRLNHYPSQLSGGEQQRVA